LCLVAPPNPVPGAVRKPLLCPYPYTLSSNYFNNVFHSVLVVYWTASDMASSRQYRHQRWSLTCTSYVQAWLSVVAPTCHTFPTASSRGMRQRRCSTCKTCGRGCLTCSNLCSSRSPDVVVTARADKSARRERDVSVSRRSGPTVVRRRQGIRPRTPT